MKAFKYSPSKSPIKSKGNMEQFIVTCLQFALTKELEIGPGVVFVQDNEIGFVKEEDISPEAFKEEILKLIREDDRKHVFVVHKDNLNLHVSKIIRPPSQLPLM